MKNDIVSDGPVRLLETQMAKRRIVVQKQFADEWAKANFFKRIPLRFRIQHEVLKSLNWKEVHKPSPQTLW